MFLGFVDAEKTYDRSLGSDCEKGLIIPWLMGRDCAQGLVCSVENICVARDSSEGKVSEFWEGVLISKGGNLIVDRGIMFVLILTVIFGILSSVNIFETKKQSKKGTLINLIISASLGLLGIRFLPENLISSLATPATAMVALIIAGMPFLLIHVITGKWLKERNAINKVRTIWIIYFLLIIGLIINNIISQTRAERAGSIIALVVFLALAIIELIFVPLRSKMLAKKGLSNIESQGESALRKARDRWQKKSC